jgi:hypothetical protein
MNRFQPALAGKSEKTLAQLKPQIGERVRLETRSPRGRYSVQLIGLREGASVIVSAPRTSGTPLLLNEGAPVTLRLMAGNWICAFDTRLLKIQTTPYHHWHLAYPTRIDAQRVRQHTRVPVNLAVAVDIDDLEPAAVDYPMTACCTDIHLAGACIEAPRLLARVGQKIFITARIAVAGIDHVLLVPALVRNVHESESGSFSVISHGVEFVDLEEETQLILAGFVYQQHLIETGLLASGEEV